MPIWNQVCDCVAFDFWKAFAVIYNIIVFCFVLENTNTGLSSGDLDSGDSTATPREVYAIVYKRS